MNNQDIENDINNYRHYITQFRSSVNIHGIWLFLATLSVWGVNQNFIRLAATFMILIIFLFLVHTSDKSSENRSFTKIEKEIISKIHNTLEGEALQNRLNDLREVSSNRKSFKTIVIQSPIFIICYFFYIISLVYFFTLILPYSFHNQ